MSATPRLGEALWSGRANGVLDARSPATQQLGSTVRRGDALQRRRQAVDRALRLASAGSDETAASLRAT